ncbi:uncharacterized protein LOC106523974 [Austrofundulus limnaeus]|uniref:Uncharacterized protein LOC106523974 n=1 Tax=Austrofundulus limnaeus TaxID=52670 RepID=A0A2I4BZ52_AUSLI|nr:PREDICTED: uncharacterized protein LOC106523974 [Austrofundulus limnaeus]XP_013873029.1 PREDICTED: uncharacterized protein LOC106523974 [Austrofundulus limnaeus]
MGQLLSSEEQLPQLKEALGSVIYDAMLEGDAVPDLRVVHPLLLTNQNDNADSQTRLQEHLQQLQSEIGNRVPAYLKDLVSRLSAFSDEPSLTGLVGLVITMVVDMAYASSKQSSGEEGRAAGSSSCQQRICELQEVMDEYLKRCRINLSDKSRLIQDSVRLEAQFSLILTQLKTCLLGAHCDSRSLRHWACAAVFHTQMLVHLACLEDKAEPLSARAVLNQYQEDLKQIIPAYRKYKSNTVSVVKCRGVLLPNFDPAGDVPEEGAMTGLTVMDRETGRSVNIPLSVIEKEIGRRMQDSELSDATSASSRVNLDLITSDQCAQVYLEQLFSSKGPVAELEKYFTKASQRLEKQRTCIKIKNETGKGQKIEQSEEVYLSDQAEGMTGYQKMGKTESRDNGTRNYTEDASLKLSIVETQPEGSLT